jgi:hypothetical protein
MPAKCWLFSVLLAGKFIKQNCHSRNSFVYSGCSTFLKTVAGETNGFFIDEKSDINYQGIDPEQMHNDFRGEAIYTAEVDVHFPMLSTYISCSLRPCNKARVMLPELGVPLVQQNIC